MHKIIIFVSHHDDVKTIIEKIRDHKAVYAVNDHVKEETIIFA